MVMGISKNIYRAILILTFVAVNTLILFGISSVLAFLNTGADRSSMLQTEIKKSDAYLPEIHWESLDNPGRPMETQSLEKIQKDYLNAWYIRNVAYKTNNPFGLEDFFTSDSRKNIFSTIDLNKSQNVTIESTTLSHQPKLEFYSADGQLVVFTDRNVVEYQKVFRNKELVAATEDTSTYQVAMLLEDGFWRIRHMVKMEAGVQPELLKSNQLIQVVNRKIMIDKKPFVIKGINYYPQATPWNMFGDEFNEAIVAKDFQIIRKAGLNCVRIFVQYEDFGKADVKSEKLDKLKVLLDQAEKLGLKVIITLFDFYGDYAVLDWSLTHRHAEKIVTEFRDHPAVLAWDLKNEPDLDFKTRGKENVLAWLSHLAVVIRKFDPNHLVTIGWATPEAAVNLTDDVDLVSFHYYRDVDEFKKHFAILESEVPDKPLVLEEFGMSSYRGLWNVMGNSLNDQAEYHQKMQNFFQEKEVSFLSWTLYDFDDIPVSVVGHKPWHQSKQKYFGFLDRLGNPKPASRFISN